MDNNKPIEKKNANNERGAALVMVLIISTLLLIVGGSLLLSASVNTANVTDSLSEQQAYYAAESGLNTALNVLRGNVVASSLFDPTALPSAAVNKITYRKAVTKGTSNAPNDSALEARLSRWITYKYSGNASDRVGIGEATSNTDFRLSIEQTSNNNDNVTFSTTGTVNGLNQYSIDGGKVIIKFVGKNTNDINMLAGHADTDIGSFDIKVTAGGAALNQDVRFSIVYQMTAPNKASRVLRGWIRRSNATITNNTVGNLKFDFDAPYFELTGSKINITPQSVTPNAPNVSGGLTPINTRITPPEPQRLVVRSTGFGPRGARKQLEAIVQKDLFGGLYAPATLTMVGSQSGFYFNQGNSNVTTYSGQDLTTPMMIPPIGTAVPGFNIDALATQIANSNVNMVGYPGDVTAETPDWLKTAAELNATISQLRLIAQSTGRYYASGVTPPNFGDFATGKGITFIDGDAELRQQDGGGILVCTGKLTFHGAYNFKGLIIVTGAAGIKRSGGGNGSLLGNLVVAPYNPNNLTAGFLGPKYDLSGGGNSTIRYDSSSVFNGLEALDNIVIGLAEK